ncbi:MAG: dihydrolipoyl dehydrogenase [Deltaproteobacteria bacterium]|nr:dihydrolipoyl dehydrogenase [Deltaproteobacteria bacterium]MBU51467.1 dihydrolipoyl dehydrogenase [Deltaproteobacteria bacterium]|tara:strand:+ start:685 stop:2466 length:1782 start_codon:yes stop_codon:yes gene_type:complete
MSTEVYLLPDIGDFQDVDVIEVHIEVGQTLDIDDPLITLENDKASMDLPMTQPGVVKEVFISVGDTVNEGDKIFSYEATGDKKEDAPKASSEKAEAAPERTAPSRIEVGSVPISNTPIYDGKVDVEVDVAVLGSGPGGYTAVFRASDLGLKTALIEKDSTLGGVCLNVGCIPSKALLHAAKVIEEAKEFASHGIKFGQPEIDLDSLRDWKNSVVKKLTGGLDGLSKQRKVQVVKGYGTFLDPHHIEVDNDGEKQVVKFQKCIIAAGSEPVRLPFVPEDPRIIDSTGALELRDIPSRMLVIGGGIIGLEMATVYHSLGSKLTIVEMLDGLMMGADRDIVRPFMRRVKNQYEDILLETRVTKVEALDEGLRVTFEGKNAPKEPQLYDMILVSVGRRPNGKKLSAENAGVQVTEQGFIKVNKQMSTNVPHIFAIGDIVGQPMLAHKASHEGKVAAEVCAGQNAAFDAKVIPSVAYTDPEVAWVGLTETEAKRQRKKVGKGVFPWAASGRSLALNRSEGMTKLIFDPETEQVLGAGIVGPNAGELIAEISLAIEMGADATDIGLTIHPHPTLSETVAFAAEAFEGTITDLYMPKRKK